MYYTRGYWSCPPRSSTPSPVLLHLAGDGGEVLFACLLRRDPADVVTPYGYGGPVGAGENPPLAAFPAAYEVLVRAPRRGVELRGLPPAARQRGFARGGGLSGGSSSRAPSHGRSSARTWRRCTSTIAAWSSAHRPSGTRSPASRRRRTSRSSPAAYEATMRRAGAAPFYFFRQSYWDALLRGVKLVRVDVRDRGELLASVLGMGEPPWLHYHLGGATDAARGTGASHLALYGPRRWGATRGYDTLHLGGGVGGRADSLLEYKLRFAPDGRLDAAIGKAVHDLAAYLRADATRRSTGTGSSPPTASRLWTPAAPGRGAGARARSAARGRAPARAAGARS